MKKLIVTFLLLLTSLCYAGTYGGGAGTSGDPWQIDDAADWAELVATSADWDQKYFILTSDIDFSGAEAATVGIDATDDFDSEFDGNDKMLYNLLLTDATAHNDQNGTAVFSIIGSNALIKDLTVADATITGETPDATSSYNAVICAEMTNGSTIDNCTVINSVVTIVMNKAAAQIGYAGPIAGAAHGSITNCTVVGGILRGDNTDSSSRLRLGGIAGVIPSANSGDISNSTSSVFITDVAAATTLEVTIGGVVGDMPSDGGFITGCTFTGEIDYTTGTLTTPLYVGGVLGAGVDEIVSNCSSKCNIRVEAGGVSMTVRVGGFVGYSENTGVGTYTGCSADTVIRIKEISTPTNYVGGFAGYVYGASFTDCYAKCIAYDLDATPITATAFTRDGGFVAQSRDATDTTTPVYTRCWASAQNLTGGIVEIVSDNSTFTDCFWDSSTSGITSDSFVGTTPHTYAEMTARETYVGWPMSEVSSNFTWKIVAGNYPILSWGTYPLESDEDNFGTTNTAVGGGGAFYGG